MQVLSDRSVRGGFTLIEMICVIAIIAILAALLLPALAKVRHRARQTQCAGQLKEQGVAFHSFAHDHNDRFPVQVPIAQGGSAEFAQRASQSPQAAFFAYRHFRTISNELRTPKLLICPTDWRSPAASFGVLSNQHLSYFAGLNAEFTKPGSLLAGDRNLTNDWVAAIPIQRLGPNNALRWTHELHRFRGNLLFADGHVEQFGETRLPVSFGPGAANNYVLNLPVVPAQSRTNSPGGPTGSAFGGPPVFASGPAKSSRPTDDGIRSAQPSTAPHPNQTNPASLTDQRQPFSGPVSSRHPPESRVSPNLTSQPTSSGSPTSVGPPLEPAHPTNNSLAAASSEESSVYVFDLLRTHTWLRALVLLLLFTMLTLVLRAVFARMKGRA